MFTVPKRKQVLLYTAYSASKLRCTYQHWRNLTSTSRLLSWVSSPVFTPYSDLIKVAIFYLVNKINGYSLVPYGCLIILPYILWMKGIDVHRWRSLWLSSWDVKGLGSIPVVGQNVCTICEYLFRIWTNWVFKKLS